MRYPIIPLFCEIADLFHPEEFDYSPVWLVGFNQAFEPEYHDRVVSWLSQNLAGRWKANMAGEVMFEHQDEALMFYLAFK